MPPRPLPQNPNLKLINSQAKSLLQDFRQRRELTLTSYSVFYAMADTRNPRLADARHMVALKYGYKSWRKLMLHVDALDHESDSLEALLGL
jgi:hypothetical protein